MPESGRFVDLDPESVSEFGFVPASAFVFAVSVFDPELVFEFDLDRRSE